tara:strand:+ start:303 stop:452 length:150 start_codon:yes stop_codon:yes gene_type:complete
MPVVPTVMCCPPKWTALTGATGDEGTNKLEETRSLKSPVGKIAMIKGGN